MKIVFGRNIRQGHNTEAALLKVINDLRVNTDNASLLILLDTTDQCILINRLGHV